MPPPTASLFEAEIAKRVAARAEAEAATAVVERIKCLILLARSFEIRLDSTDERWKHQAEQNAFLLDQVSALKSRLDTLDAEKLISEQKAATWNVRLVYATIGATAAWVVHLTLT
jgi:hypothetical protein